MDIATVRTFVAAADAGQFQRAAVDEAISQQAVSKRVGALEAELGVRLFVRTPRGVEPTVDGQAFLPHARVLVRAAERAEAAVRPGSRALRVDVISRQVAPAALLRSFHVARPDVELDVLTLGSGVRTAGQAVAAGTVNASFRAVPDARELPEGVATARVLDEPHHLLCGPRHRLARHRTVTLAQLAGERLWIPGIAPGTEWAVYYADLAAAFGLTVDVVGPRSGTGHLVDVLAEEADVATLVGDRTRMLWPDAYDLRRVPVVDPAPVYPHRLLWRRDDAHPALGGLREHLGPPPRRPPDVWAPPWAA